MYIGMGGVEWMGVQLVSGPRVYSSNGNDRNDASFNRERSKEEIERLFNDEDKDNDDDDDDNEGENIEEERREEEEVVLNPRVFGIGLVRVFQFPIGDIHPSSQHLMMMEWGRGEDGLTCYYLCSR